MRRLVRNVVVSFALLAVNMTTEAKGSTTAERCEERWIAESRGTDARDAAAAQPLVRRWLGYGDRCRGTTVYEARLVMVLAVAGRLDEARRVLASIKRPDPRYRHLVEFAALQIEWFSQDATSDDALPVRRLESRFRAFVGKYPEFPDAYSQLGALQTMLGDHANAIASLRAALRTRMDPTGIYRNLTISHAALGQYEAALSAADQAYSRQPSLTSDVLLTCAYAKAAAGIGRVEDAETALSVVAAKQPGVTRTAAFRDAAEFVVAHRSAQSK